jgi:hypothetical protein
MSRSLPPAPSLEYLKKQAKQLLREHAQGKPGVAATLRLLPRFVTASDAEILAADVTLAEVQQALAMEYGFKNWAILRELVTQTFTPDAAWPVEYYKDYRWSKGTPVGIDQSAKPPVAAGFFRFIRLANGVRVEQYDARRAFIGVCHDPSDREAGERKIKWEDGSVVCGAARVDAIGCVRTYEVYTVLAPGNPPQVKAEIYTADGRLIETHTPRRFSDTAEDIHVTDRLGKPKVILHHRGIDKGEPYDIEEEWAE